MKQDNDVWKGRNEFMAKREDWADGFSLYMRAWTGTETFFAQPLTLVKAEPAQYAEPIVRLDMMEAQHLMDELWRCGLRPTEGTGSAGSLAATQSHLHDMQNIAFKLLNRMVSDCIRSDT